MIVHFAIADAFDWHLTNATLEGNICEWGRSDAGDMCSSPGWAIIRLTMCMSTVKADWSSNGIWRIRNL
jgi:hypothetical protein